MTALLGLNAYLIFWVKDPRLLQLKGLVEAMSAAAFAGGAWTWFFLKKKENLKSFFSAAATVYTALIFVIIAMKSILTPYMSTFPMAETLNRTMRASDEVALYSSPDHFSDLPFHLKRRVIIVGSDRGTLTEELEEPQYADEAKIWFPTSAEFVGRFNEHRERLFCLMDRDNLKELEHIGLVSYKTVQEDAGKILISNET